VVGWRLGCSEFSQPISDRSADVMSRLGLSLLFALFCRRARGQTPGPIVLPEPFALEMPRGAASLPADSGRLAWTARAALIKMIAGGNNREEFFHE
jgi:hypothetical protein